MKKILKWIAIVFFGLVTLGIALDATKSPEEKAADAAARAQRETERAAAEREKVKQEMATLPSYTSNQIAMAYNQNTVAADQKFKGQKFKVTGSVVDISTGFTGDPYLTLRGGVNQFMEPQFHFEKSELQTLANLKKGAKVTLVCTGQGDIAKTPMSKECSIQ